MTSSVALLGLGYMGAGMARNLAKADLPLTVWNRSPEKAEALADIATVAATPAEAVAGAGVVVTMLFDADSTVETMRSAREALAPGTVWVQMATVGVAGHDRVADLADELGVTLVDAPVLGTRKPAEDGTLVVLASGPDPALEAVQPVFDAVGARTMRLGEAGKGSRLKLAANAYVATVVAGIADSLALARDLDLDPALFLEAVEGGAMDSPYVQMMGPKMLAESFAPNFALSALLKDLDLILGAARDAGTDLSPLEGIRSQATRAVDAGHGEEDLTAIWLAHRSG